MNLLLRAEAYLWLQKLQFAQGCLKIPPKVYTGLNSIFKSISREQMFKSNCFNIHYSFMVIYLIGSRLI